MDNSEAGALARNAPELKRGAYCFFFFAFGFVTLV